MRRSPPRLLALALGVALAPATAMAQDVQPDLVASATRDAPPALEGTILSAIDVVLADAAQRAARSVVLIEVERPNYGPRQLTRRERAGLGLGGWYDPRYFARPEGPVSGVVVGPGLIATSTWNLAGDGAVVVVGPDGERYPARRAGRDENLELSLLTIDDPDALVPLEPARGPFAVGRSLLLIGRTSQNTASVTRGIVSGLDRQRGDAFTHSARTHFANTGGALVDLEGRLLGVSVRHAEGARQGQSSGVGFGAATERLTSSLPIMTKGEVVPLRPRAFLGIRIDPQYAGAGVRVLGVIEGTAAHTAGLAEGDVIRIFNNVEIQHFNQLVEEIQKLEVGTPLLVTIGRGKEELDVKVELGRRPEGE